MFTLQHVHLHMRSLTSYCKLPGSILTFNHEACWWPRMPLVFHLLVSLWGLLERSCSPSSPIKWICCGWCNENKDVKMFHTGFQVSCKAMAESHVQHAIIRTWTLNLRITCTRHYPIEPLINLNCSLIHMVKMTIDKHTTFRHPQAHISQVN